MEEAKHPPATPEPKEIERLLLDNLFPSQATHAEDLAEVLGLPLTDVKDALTRLFLQGAVKLDPDAQGGWRLPVANTDPMPDGEEEEVVKAQSAQAEANETAQPDVEAVPAGKSGEFREPENPASDPTSPQQPSETTPLATVVDPKRIDTYLLELLDGEDEEERFALEELDGYNGDDVRNGVKTPRYTTEDIKASLDRLVEQKKARFDPKYDGDVGGWYLPRAKQKRLPPKDTIEKKLIQARDKLVKMTANMAHERWRDFAMIVEAIYWYRDAQAQGKNDVMFDLGDGEPVEGNADALLTFMFGDTGPLATQFRKTVDYITDKAKLPPDEVYAWIEKNHGLDEAYRNNVAKKQTNPRTSGVTGGGNKNGSSASSLSSRTTTTKSPSIAEPADAGTIEPTDQSGAEPPPYRWDEIEDMNDDPVPEPDQHPDLRTEIREEDAETREAYERLWRFMRLAFHPMTPENEADGAFHMARNMIANHDLGAIFYNLAKHDPTYQPAGASQPEG